MQAARLYKNLHARIFHVVAVLTVSSTLVHAQLQQGGTPQPLATPPTNAATPTPTPTPTPSPTPVDPGPRPVGNQSKLFAGAHFTENGATVTLLKQAIVNFHQPPDQLGNEGAGQVLQFDATTGSPDRTTAFFWGNSVAVFGQNVSVDGALDASGNPTIPGLGPAFNGTSCFMCHSQPTIGGTSPGRGTNGFTENPQIAAATALGAKNVLPQFITANGPIQEARFIFDLANDSSGNTVDGGVHELFSIQGRSDASNCTLAQPDFSGQTSLHNVIFRIPTPTFGLGMVENTSEDTFLEYLNAIASEAGALSPPIHGHFNHDPNDGAMSKFGWKAQNKSLLLFAGEAANVELGLTNELFNNEKAMGSGCTSISTFGNGIVPAGTSVFGTSEDNTHVAFASGVLPEDTDSLVSSAIENFAIFMRINGAPSQCAYNSGLDSTGAAQCIAFSSSSDSTSILRGKTLFDIPSRGGVGCALCHSNQAFLTDPSPVKGLSNRTFTPFSDFALHHMGATLADGISQGQAGPDEFRTAPLWGLGQRLFFLHDGRTGNLAQAIQDHFSDPSICYTTTTSQNITVQGHAFTPSTTVKSCGSEANAVVQNFQKLSLADRNNLLKYLRSL
ncbi:MAG TPA: di-heme oxidoredictase family protein [Candidatus Angelobacter sp.]|nr:di-heme oxidoredictase family protein [Candidatus Angelobacter sp.]